MTVEPRKIVKLAKPGQLPGLKDAADDYREAAPLAFGSPGEPVIVHEFDLVGERDELNRVIAAELRIASKVLNAADDLAGAAPSLERFQVSQATVKDDKVIRTYIVFHPDGRPTRTRNRTQVLGEVADDGTGKALPEFDPEHPEQTFPAEPKPLQSVPSSEPDENEEPF